MLWFLFLLAGLAGALIGSAAVLRWLFSATAAPPPQMADPQGTPDCSIPPAPASPIPFPGRVNGGTFHGQQIVIPQGMTLTITSDLTLVADDLLQVDGSIVIPPGAPPGTPQVNISLVSKQGDVKIGPTGIVGQPFLGAVQAAAGPPANAAGPNAVASSGAAGNAGWIRVVAAQGSIDVLGRISALGGGFGGSATANGLLASSRGVWLRPSRHFKRLRVEAAARRSPLAAPAVDPAATRARMEATAEQPAPFPSFRS